MGKAKRWFPPGSWENVGSLDGAVVKNIHANTGDVKDTGSVPGLGWCPGVGNSKPLQYSCLENSMNRRDWGLGGGLQSGGCKEWDMAEHTHPRTHTHREYSGPLLLLFILKGDMMEGFSKQYTTWEKYLMDWDWDVQSEILAEELKAEWALQRHLSPWSHTQRQQPLDWSPSLKPGQESREMSMRICVGEMWIIAECGPGEQQVALSPLTPPLPFPLTDLQSLQGPSSEWMDKRHCVTLCLWREKPDIKSVALSLPKRCIAARNFLANTS